MDQRQHFERTVWPHLRSAQNLARWLLGNRNDAEDVVQESFLQAFRSLDQFRGGDPRAWILAIVRNTAYNHLQRKVPKAELPWDQKLFELADRAAGPESRLLAAERRRRLLSAMTRLPPELRDPLVLRGMEGLAYKEIAAVLNIPIGTVMSRLSRARKLVSQEFTRDKENGTVQRTAAEELSRQRTFLGDNSKMPRKSAPVNHRSAHCPGETRTPAAPTDAPVCACGTSYIEVSELRTRHGDSRS